jgi:sialidase-1
MICYIKTILLLLILFAFTLGKAQQKFVPVFTSGEEGHKSYRIPAIISLPNGDLLAFAEGRVNGPGDFGDINIVLKRSSDNGKTWKAFQTIVDYDSLQVGNPAPVVDLLDPRFPKGRIFLFYNTGNNHEYEVRKGKGLREVWYKTSSDGGVTWSKAVNITTDTHRPNQPQINRDYQYKEDWRSYANTPGHAMQFSSGKYKGRIFVAANHSAGDPKEDASDYCAHGFYSNDHGQTFHLGATINQPGSNESTATQISNNILMMNSRNQKGDIRARIVSLSSTGGETWDTTYFDNTLIDPVNEGSILTLGMKKGKTIVAFCNAASMKDRDNLMLRISEDNGKSWIRSYVIDKSAEGLEKDHAAYSDLVKISEYYIGILYERNSYAQIVFTSQKWK